MLSSRSDGWDGKEGACSQHRGEKSECRGLADATLTVLSSLFAPVDGVRSSGRSARFRREAGPRRFNACTCNWPARQVGRPGRMAVIMDAMLAMSEKSSHDSRRL